MLIFYAFLPYVCFPFLHIFFHFFSGCFTHILFIWETNKVVTGHVRQVVVLYSNNCMGICLGGLSTDCLRCVGHLIQVLICAVLTVVNNLKLSQGL